MFSEASVILSTGRGGRETETPLDRDPHLDRDPLPDRDLSYWHLAAAAAAVVRYASHWKAFLLIILSKLLKIIFYAAKPRLF